MAVLLVLSLTSCGNDYLTEEDASVAIKKELATADPYAPLYLTDISITSNCTEVSREGDWACAKCITTGGQAYIKCYITCPPVCRDSESVATAVSVTAWAQILKTVKKMPDNWKGPGPGNGQKDGPQFKLNEKARKWLEKQDASTAVMIPARDKDNKLIVLVSGLRKDETRIKESRYFVMKP
jgi:hypothetical protein